MNQPKQDPLDLAWLHNLDFPSSEESQSQPTPAQIREALTDQRLAEQLATLERKPEVQLDVVTQERLANLESSSGGSESQLEKIQQELEASLPLATKALILMAALSGLQLIILVMILLSQLRIQ